MHDPETKANVVAALLTGMGISECAQRYGVPKGTVAGWRDENFRTNPNGESNEPLLAWLPARGRDWRENFEGYVNDALYGLRVQVAYLTRPDVLERTDYAAIVDAHGSLADRVARITETVGHVDAGTDHQLDAGATAA